MPCLTMPSCIHKSGCISRAPYLADDFAGYTATTRLLSGCTAELRQSACAGDRHISYLPLAHIYERVLTVGFIAHGVSIGFFRCRCFHVVATTVQNLVCSTSQLRWSACR